MDLELIAAVSTGLLVGVPLAGAAGLWLAARHDRTVNAALPHPGDWATGIGDEPDPAVPAATQAPAWSLADTIQLAAIATAAATATLAATGGVPLSPWRAAPPASTAEHPTPRTQPVCPTCESRRCRPHREGRDCRHDGITEPAAYASWRPAGRDGRHTLTARLAAWRRRLRLSYLAQAVALDPAWYASKLGRPVAIGGAVRCLP